MADASYAQNSFLGGLFSKSMQGRFDRPDYKTALNVCLNGLPIESGPWTRRPGSRHGGTSRSGAAGRLVTFSFKQSTPYTIEFTDGHMRFWNGPSLVTTNDTATVSSVSLATPALMTLDAAVDWLTGDQMFFNNPTIATPLLMRRMFSLTKLSTTTFTLADALTGANIDGAALGVVPFGATVSRALDIVTPFVAGSWSALRSVQAETQTMLLTGAAPQILTAAPPVLADTFATFSLAAAAFTDGPYLDPLTNGALITPSALTGIVNLTLSFAAYSATKSYDIGAYVTSASLNYKSLITANLNNTPATSPTAWLAVSATSAIGPNGFQGSDIGRHIRLYSEPAIWVVGTSYVAGNVVAYPSGVDGSYSYYTCLANNTAALTNAPGISLTTWGVNASGAIWTWGKITGLLNMIAAATGTPVGDMTANGGLAAAFDGVTNQSASACAAKSGTTGVPAGPGTTATLTVTGYVGKNYGPAQAISFATLFPSSDQGLAQVVPGSPSVIATTGIAVTVNLRGKATVPASASDGTLLGTSGALSAIPLVPLTIQSSDAVTTWAYVWFEIIVTQSFRYASIGSGTVTITDFAAEAQFYSPSAGVGNGVTAQILGPNLLYTTAVRTWRLGLYSGSTGSATCGTYHEGRVWLSGSVPNRFDGSVPISHPNGLTTIDFAPTKYDGTVTDANAISYTLDGPDVNPIFWMVPDQQGIIIGTQAGEWLVQATSTNAPLTPVSIQAHRVTTIGCANIEPKRTEHTLVFVQRFKHKLMEYFADVFSGKFSAPNLSMTGKNLATRGLEEVAYQQELSPVIWGRCTDGSLIGVSYKRESLTSSQGPTFAGWHEHELGSGRTVESICTGPSTDGLLDTLAMMTNDAVTGIRHVEFLTNLWEEASPISTAWYCDDAVIPAATETVGATLKLYGLWHLIGQTVAVFAGGLDTGDYLVAADGTAVVPFGAAGGLFTSAFVATFTDGIPIVVGFTYNSRGQLLRPATREDSGARNGPPFGKKRRNQQVVALLQDTQGIYIGTDFARIRLAQLTSDGGSALTPLELKSGMHRDSVGDDYSYDGMMAWEIRRPYPATVVVMGGLLQTQDA